MTRVALLALVALLAPAIAHAQPDAPARGGLWERAIEAGAADASRDRYEQALHDGDELAQRANAKGQNRSTVTSLVDQAIRAYQLAAAARPKEAEPHFRIASVVEAFFTDCGPAMIQRPATCPLGGGANDPVRARQAVEAWDAFEARAPLDPRLADALFNRAILRTKLVVSARDVKPLLEGALRDYSALLDRADGLTMVRLDQVWGNLAETYMMLGKLDEAVEAYQVAIDKGGSGSTVYGKAVALDRDERTAEAFELIRRQGPEAFDSFREEFMAGQVFYVPAGEEHYYFGLIYEAFNYRAEAIDSWNAFLASGAHPQYQPRAKAHLDALVLQQRAAPRPRPRLDPFESYP